MTSRPCRRTRVATCHQFVIEIGLVDRALADTRARLGPIPPQAAAGHSRDIRRFPTGGHYARDNGTAPLEASSGPRTRHRLNPRGNRQLNHAIHTAALTQIAHDHPGRAYHERKQAEGNTNKEAMRALKRRISDVV